MCFFILKKQQGISIKNFKIRMEGFSDFESQYSENRLPTVSELKEIKQMLLTGDRDQIIQSVERIKVFLNCQESISEILRSDISEFLCDAVIPLDSVIVCTVYHCVELMTRHVEFFTHNHSCFAIESLIRTLHFIMKDSSSYSGLNQCLNLLNFILQGYNTHGVHPEKKTIENLLQMVPALLTNLLPTLNNKYQTGVLILSLAELGVMKWGQEACEMLLTNLSSWFNSLIETLELEHPIKEKLILLCSTLCYSVLRPLVSDEGSVEEVNFEVNVNLKSDIVKHVSVFLISIGAPYFDTVTLNSIENDPSHAEKFYETILCFYTKIGTLETHHLTHGLSEMGFLQFTTKIISFADFSHGHKLRILCVFTLFHVILYLSEEVFTFPEVWESGREDFRREVWRGISQLPVDASVWLDVLVNPEASPSCQLALFLYLYFYSMTAKSQDMLQSLYPAVAGFIRLTNGIESSVLLLKVVWFVFVMSQLSIDQSSSLESETEIMAEMVFLLEAQPDLSLVYTHHPAILYWAFSSDVSSKIQTEIVHLWLRNKTADCKELDEMMRKSTDVKFAILDILQNGWGQELDSAFSSLKSFLMDSVDDDLAAGIWFLLPQVLAKFTADSTSVTNVDYAIELCSLRTPQSVDVTRIIRIASLLPEVLLKSDLISVVPTLSLVLQLMQMGVKLADHRVLRFFLRHDGFLLKIMEGLRANVSDISCLSIQIMILLWKESQQMGKPETGKTVEISKGIILKLLETDHEQVLSAALVFLREVLLSDFLSTTFDIREVTPGFVQILFVEIQNVCIKSTADISSLCWSCLKLCLTLPRDGSLQDELVTSPLLHETILFSLPRLNTSQELKGFLTVWVELYNAKFNDPCFERRIFGKFYTKTLQRVGRKLMEDKNGPEDQALLEKVFEKTSVIPGRSNNEVSFILYTQMGDV